MTLLRALLVTAALLVAPSLVGCTSRPSPGAEILGGRCRCEADSALCVQVAGAPGVAPVCVVAQGGCASLSSGSRACWGSPNVSGLCLCNGSLESLARNP